MKDIALSAEQKAVLEKISIRQLAFFSRISQDKDFPEFSKVINLIIDIEKNKFYGENEYDEKKLVMDHAYSRGGAGMLVKLIRLISVAQHELEKRTEKE